MRKIRSSTAESDGELQEGLQQVEDEFRDWARKFAANREGKLLALGKETLSSTQTELEYSDRLRPIFAEVVSTIRNYLRAHIAEAGTTLVTLDLPDLPENLYSKEYAGTVVLGDTMTWHIVVSAKRPASRTVAKLVIALEPMSEELDPPSDSVKVIIYLGKVVGGMAVTTVGDVPSVGPLPRTISEEDPGSAIVQLVQGIVEAQLLRL